MSPAGREGTVFSLPARGVLIDAPRDLRYAPRVMTLLQTRDAARRQRRLQAREETRERLRRVLTDLIPGERVIIFGSLVRPGVFNDASDIDLALERKAEPA